MHLTKGFAISIHFVKYALRKNYIFPGSQWKNSFTLSPHCLPKIQSEKFLHIMHAKVYLDSQSEICSHTMSATFGRPKMRVKWFYWCWQSYRELIVHKSFPVVRNTERLGVTEFRLIELLLACIHSSLVAKTLCMIIICTLYILDASKTSTYYGSAHTRGITE